MRKAWLGLAALLVGGGSVQAQRFPPVGYPEPTPMPPSVAPNYGYPGFPPAPVAPPTTSRYPGWGNPNDGLAVPISYQPYPYYPPQAPGPQPSASPPPVAAASVAPPFVQRPTPIALTDVVGSYIANKVATADTIAYHRPHDERFWFRGDFVMSRINAGPLSTPLVTSGAIGNPHPGALNPADPGTAILFGGNGLNYSMQPGFRIEGGYFFDSENRYSIDLGAMVLAQTNINYAVSSTSNGDPILARPIFNTLTNDERSVLTSFPGAIAGSVSVESQSSFWSLELNGRRHAYLYENLHAEGLVGFRTLSLREKLRIQDNLKELNGGFLSYNGQALDPGDRLLDHDLFQTANQFYGFQLGGALTLEREWFTLGLISKLGLGMTDQQSTIEGSTSVVSSTLGNSTSPGGILAQVTNIGNRHNYVFGLVPEFGANLGVNLHKNVRFTTGYTFLLWNSVLRPGDLIDRAINPGLPPGSPTYGVAGPPRPAYNPQDSTMLLHTFNFGLEVHY